MSASIPNIDSIEMSGVGVYTTTAGIWPPPGESDFETLADLAAAVFVSVHTDARIEPHELAPGEFDRRGWWGDSFPEVEGDTWGGKLHLEQRGKIGAAIDRDAPGVTTPEAIRSRIADALQWMVEDGVAAVVTVTAELRADARGVDVLIVINRARGGDPVSLRYSLVWEELRNA